MMNTERHYSDRMMIRKARRFTPLAALIHPSRRMTLGRAMRYFRGRAKATADGRRAR